jgi:heat shock protein HtpX
VNDLASQNKRRAAVQLLSFALVLTAVVFLLLVLFVGPLIALLLGVVSGAVGAYSALRFGASTILSISGAQPASREKYARFHNLVDGLSVGAGVVRPELYVVQSGGANVFTVARAPGKTSLCATTGLLRKLDRIELEAVVAHELTHVRALETYSNTVTVATVGSVPLLADYTDLAVQNGRKWMWPLALLFGLLMFAAPLFAWLLRRSTDPDQECLADLRGVAVTRYPPGMAAALETLKNTSTVVDSGSRAAAHLWISSPFGEDDTNSGARSAELFETHSPLEERIAVLREL